MSRILVLDGRAGFVPTLLERLGLAPEVRSTRAIAPADRGAWEAAIDAGEVDVVIYAPSHGDRAGTVPDLAEAEGVFRACAGAGLKVVLISSAAVYGPNTHNTGLLGEIPLSRRHRANRTAAGWIALETLAEMEMGGGSLTRLRPAPTLIPGGRDYFSRLFRRRVVIGLLGYDPVVQLLSPPDLADASTRAVSVEPGGTYNVAPAGGIPLREAHRVSGTACIGLPGVLHRLAYSVLHPLGLSPHRDQLDYLRHSSTVSDRALRDRTEYVPRSSSFAALRDHRRPGLAPADTGERSFDAFGMDEPYIRAHGRGLFRFLQDDYWRIEVRGIEEVPRRGRAVLAGVHRGFMPWDGVMAVHLITHRVGRVPRFLIHPGLVKFPVLARFLTRLGGMIMCRENADRVMKEDELLGIFPEGIHGAFRLYRDAYRLDQFGHDEYVRIALRHRAPIVPFVTLGSAETFPILRRLDWAWWKRWTEWPAFPITPTFPLLPIPLPSKWHMRFLPAVHVERLYPPEAADDRETVRAIAEQIRVQVEAALREMLGRRRSIFFGSVFDPEPGAASPGACPGDRPEPACLRAPLLAGGELAGSATAE